MIKIKLPLSAKIVLNTLHKAGFQAYIVGGCVRDAILNLAPNDWDITTDATPDDIKKLFADAIPIGEKYGTITVGIHDEAGMWCCYHEVTTFRSDGEYSDGRRPDSVTFGTSLKEDLERRDFTINALAYNEEEGLIDYFNGLQDLNNKIIKTVGDPKQRFNEDALRLVRCIRFAITYNFIIEEDTKQICFEMLNDNKLDLISKERIHDEIMKMIFYFHAGISKELRGIMSKIFMHEPLWFVTNRHCNIWAKLAGIYLDMDINELSVLLNNLRFSRNEVKSIINVLTAFRTLALAHSEAYNNTKSFKYLMRKAIFLTRYDDVKHVLPLISFPNSECFLNEVRNDPCNISSLCINGNDLQQDFNFEGKVIGEVLNFCMEEVLQEPKHNVKEILYLKIKESNQWKIQ